MSEAKVYSPEMRPLTAKYSVELGYSFNTLLGDNLTWWKNAVMNQDMDFVILVDGNEGSGKSVLAMQIAQFLDIDGIIDINTQLCFYPEEVKKAILNLKKFKAIVWDEARRGLNRRRSTEKVNIEMTDLFAECRQHNLFLVVVMPSFYDMDMNLAVWRSRALVHVWYDWNHQDIDKPLRRGYFRFYSEQGKKKLYCDRLLRRMYKYPLLRGDCFDATFTNYYVVDEEQYRMKKRKAENKYSEEKDKGRCPNCGGGSFRFIFSQNKRACRLCGWKGEAQPKEGRSVNHKM